MNIWTEKSRVAMARRIVLRKHEFRQAREHGVGIKAAKRAAANAWRWYDDDGSALPFSEAPRLSSPWDTEPLMGFH
jgi:hypothetical protein